ncbi:hypothetical protein GCM10009665_15260 [Kitasatospora nipponensis]|uniref:Uncharacterized protein n=1 Tax=Kitasatospora nipponensis TaxID=258049 RepID=A0ABN1VWK0_9ACTN
MADNYDELRESVTANDGLYTIDMGTLRDIQRAGRLGIHVRDAISRSLQSHGMGHIPGELPGNQYDEVRLYLLGSPIGDIVKAVLSPSNKGDDALRAVNASEAQDQLRRIREIVNG